MFNNQLTNRTTFPTRHVLVCEDDIQEQARIAQHFAELFGGQGHVQVSFVPGGGQAAGVCERIGVELILLDHDMPYGSGPEFLAWLHETGRYDNDDTKIITFSGIPANNDALFAAGAHHRFSKEDVITGKADTLILQILGL